VWTSARGEPLLSRLIRESACHGEHNPAGSIVHCLTCHIVQYLSRFEGARCGDRRQGDDQPKNRRLVHRFRWDAPRAQSHDCPWQADRPILACEVVEEEEPRLNSGLAVQQNQSRRANRVDSCWDAQLRLPCGQKRLADVLLETLEELSEESAFTIRGGSYATHD